MTKITIPPSEVDALRARIAALECALLRAEHAILSLQERVNPLRHAGTLAEIRRLVGQ